eukprot:gene16305-19350_t
MQAEQLSQLEQLCERLYNSADPAERSHAEQTLRGFWSSTEYISQCQVLLDQSSHPYAHLLAANSLVRQVTESSVTPKLRLDIRNYVLTFLFNHGQSLEVFVATALVQLLCRTTKLGWFDTDTATAAMPHHEIVQDVMKFLQAGPSHYYLGLKILNQLAAEMNQPTQGRSLTHHRKTAVSFRDTSLLQMFQVSLQSLGQLQRDPAADLRHREQAMCLALKCLSFDFVGTSLDESTEDLGNIQASPPGSLVQLAPHDVPSSWRAQIEDPATMQLFLDVYAATTPPLSNTALECLTRLASVRRSLFTTESDRNKFL